MPVLQRATVSEDALCSEWRNRSLPLRRAHDLDPLIERIGNARFVLMGEASPGTSEYYLWRAILTLRLIEEKGFRFIAVEGDWPDCYRVNRYIKGMPDSGASAREVLRGFERWPTWMWANWEIVALAEGLRKINENRRDDDKVGFFGLDVYSLWDSMSAVVRYLERVDGVSVAAAKRAYACFEPYGENVQSYGYSTLGLIPRTCEDEVVHLLREMRGRAQQFKADGPDGYFDAEQNALIVKNAEHYYRTMVRGGPDSWNVRDRHMSETLDRLSQHHGPASKAIVWEHNTHIGDARATNMIEAGMVNIGQLAREQYGENDVVLIGFGSHRGSVIAGDDWGAPMRKMEVPPARSGSWESIMHEAAAENRFMLFDRSIPSGFREPRGHRAIGVVYHPEYERYGNYVPTILPERYDAFLYLDQTKALHPLHISAKANSEPPETYPWNV